MNTKTSLLIIGALLLAVGIFKPNLCQLCGNESVVVDVENLDLATPSSEKLKIKAKDVIKALSVNNDRKVDGIRLAKLFNDMATLIKLDGEDEVIKNTEEIRQANKLAGLMLKLNIKNKYENLGESAEALVLEAIGDDNVLLNSELREKAVEGFQALAWACKEGAK